MNKIVYIRPSLAEEEEVAALQDLGLPWTLNRATIPPGTLVVGRYSVLPYYYELVSELAYNNSELINSRAEHDYVADVGAYALDLGELTPKTWRAMSDVPKDIGPLVLKGATNSKKHQWRTHMYAANWDEGITVFGRLCEDSLIGSQQIYIRQYVPLVRLGETITGLPITKEFRFFVLNNKVIASTFYWSSYNEDIVEQGHKIPDVSEVPLEFLNEVKSRLSPSVMFYAVDVAQDVTGRWWVIDVNDGQMSGLSGINPRHFYSELWRALP